MSDAAVTPEVLRAAVYLETLQRTDAPFRPSGKTRDRVKCKPPNKKCGRRCIPQNWRCRLEGGGLDSHSRAVEFDPVSGTNNIVRGTKNIIEGTSKGDPEKITRGIKGVERGIVKLTPGQTKDQKEEFRKKVKAVGTVAFTAILSGIALHRTHRTLNRFPWYANGLGQQIDDAGRAAVDSVLDTWDSGVNRLGWGSMATNRTAIRGRAAAVATRLQRQNALFRETQQGLSGPLRDRTYIANRATIREAGSNVASLRAIDARARSEGWNQARFEAEKARALYGLRTGGLSGERHSAFSQPAAHEFLARQWGFNTELHGIRATGAAEIYNTKTLLRQAVERTNTDLVADMTRRRIRNTPTGINRYIDELLRENPSIIPISLPTPQRARLRREFNQRITSLISASDRASQGRVANEMYNSAVSMYDDYFGRIADSVSVDAEGRRLVHPLNRNSAAGVADYGLARFHFSEGTIPVRPRNPTGATFLNRYYYHTRIKAITKGPKGNTAFPFDSAKQALSAARSFDSTITTVDQARQWFATNSLNVYIPQSRNLYRPDAAPEDGSGKPCGQSFIPKRYKCRTQGSRSNTTPTGTDTGIANKHDKAYRVRQIASIVARVGAIAGGAVLAQQSFKRAGALADRGFTSSAQNLSQLGFVSASVSALGALSLYRESKVTYSSDQLVSRYEDLKSSPSANPKNIAQLQKFIKDVDLDSQRVDTRFILAGLGGYFDTAKPDRVHVTNGGMTVREAAKGRNAAEAYANGMEKYMRYRSKLPVYKIDGDELQKKGNFSDLSRNFSASAWIGRDDGQMDYLLSHEIAHAIHYRGDFASPKAVVVKGKRYEGDALTKELMKSTSVYGQTDIKKRANISDNYYSQGNRLETYAENYALYVGNPQAMQKYFPVSYEWVKQTTDYALSKPPKKKARPFLDVVKDLSEGSKRFEPAKNRKDAPDYADFTAALRDMQQAATEGDTAKALQIYVQSEALGKEAQQMLGRLVETAFMYATINEGHTDGSR